MSKMCTISIDQCNGALIDCDARLEAKSEEVKKNRLKRCIRRLSAPWVYAEYFFLSIDILENQFSGFPECSGAKIKTKTKKNQYQIEYEP